jgi:hypothetical protein
MTPPKPIVHYKALASRVLMVARIEPHYGEWRVYVDAVPGINHDNEVEEVLRSGTKMYSKDAEYFFSWVPKKYPGIQYAL